MNPLSTVQQAQLEFFTKRNTFFHSFSFLTWNKCIWGQESSAFLIAPKALRRCTRLQEILRIYQVPASNFNFQHRNHRITQLPSGLKNP